MENDEVFSVIRPLRQDPGSGKVSRGEFLVILRCPLLPMYTEHRMYCTCVLYTEHVPSSRIFANVSYVWPDFILWTLCTHAPFLNTSRYSRLLLNNNCKPRNSSFFQFNNLDIPPFLPGFIPLHFNNCKFVFNVKRRRLPLHPFST